MSEIAQVDIAIVGGGLGGGLAAVALAQAGFDCALIDAVAPDAMAAEAFDGRSTAIAYGSARVFRRLGLWDAITGGAEPIRDILVTDGETRSLRRDGTVSPLHLHFDSRDLPDAEPLGWIVENRLLRRSIMAGLAAAQSVAGASISVFAPAQRVATRFGRGSAEIDLADGRTIRTRLIIAADGRTSPLRAAAGIKVNSWTYPQAGIVVTIAHERPHRGVAQELFLPAGPFAILPMTDNRSSLVWTERADAAPAYLALDDVDFLRAVRSRFGDYLGTLRLASPRSSYPLAFHLAQSFVAPRLALLGDAARAIHPIAGQGYNLGVKDVAALVDVLGDARALGLDIGSLGVLEQYQQWRRFDSAMLAFGTDALNRLFSNTIAPVRLARRLGVGAVNAAPALRRFFMRQAGADVGRLPFLMQPERI